MAYQIMFYGGLIGATISLLISLTVFFRLKIWRVIQDLTGTRTLKSRKNRNEGVKEKGKTKKITKELKLKKNEGSDKQVAATLEKQSAMPETALLQYDDVGSTELLEEELDETVLLMEEETTLLEGDEQKSVEAGEDFFVKEKEVMIIHTNRSI
ncbi:hypothetical protein [Evansella cellulosilytica]|uniref:Uncharacterized protein n=1 Tax=Evansella cellulosilytica (strain ATCC 21833 / DSM 2522 / FERM P-1141 / JCM 9156 / N-4) TaxID=649639 RepID=E6TRH8_EVAC2|nr:hypothetical protein [Evansella cellulosilytica]ADU31808.1 hypothetical protein Bcell_3567 [Evansella cellulosilytica DSM 2522]